MAEGVDLEKPKSAPQRRSNEVVEAAGCSMVLSVDFWAHILHEYA
jgi:hypothetical protein